jgi:putative flippase GtrA
MSGLDAQVDPDYLAVMPAAGVALKPIEEQPQALTFARYLAVGVCNTAFGYSCFVLFTALLTPIFAYGYVLASLLANVFSITFAFLGYKWFVFKTKGNYLKEWIRCVGVYAGSVILSAAALPLVVGVIRRQTHYNRSAPYIAGALVLVFSVLFSFFGHRHISFADANRARQSGR